MLHLARSLPFGGHALLIVVGIYKQNHCEGKVRRGALLNPKGAFDVKGLLQGFRCSWSSCAQLILHDKSGSGIVAQIVYLRCHSRTPCY